MKKFAMCEVANRDAEKLVIVQSKMPRTVILN
jgi:hypothetical protein